MLTEQKNLRDYFFGRQCRLRQYAVRKRSGQPSEGMRAVIDVGNSQGLGPINTGLIRQDSQQWSAEFRHLVKKTHDPNERFKAALKLLASSYYQHPGEFEDVLCASFLIDSELATRLLAKAECVLHFTQYQQTFRLHCEVAELAEASAGYIATYWHNSLFNASLPGRIRVLRFSPDWHRSAADPMIGN